MIDLTPLFYPKNAIALIGVSDVPIKGASAFLYALRKVGFPNPIYSINKRRDTVLFGEKAYPSLLDIPEDVKIDYVIIGVPARDVPQAIKECKQRQVKFVTVFSSGFEVLDRQFFLVFIHEPLVGYLTIAKVFINKRTTVNDRCNTVLLVQFGSESSPSCPSVDVG